MWGIFYNKKNFEHPCLTRKEEHSLYQVRFDCQKFLEDVECLFETCNNCAEKETVFDTKKVKAYIEYLTPELEFPVMDTESMLNSLENSELWKDSVQGKQADLGDCLVADDGMRFINDSGE